MAYIYASLLTQNYQIDVKKMVKIKKILALTHLPLILRITLKMWHKILYIDKQ